MKKFPMMAIGNQARKAVIAAMRKPDEPYDNNAALRMFVELHRSHLRWNLKRRAWDEWDHLNDGEQCWGKVGPSAEKMEGSMAMICYALSDLAQEDCELTKEQKRETKKIRSASNTALLVRAAKKQMEWHGA